MAENISSVLAFQKNHQAAALRSVPTDTHSLLSQLPGNGREQMGRDFLQSPFKAMTKPRPEHSVTSCSVYPHHATGTVLLAVASTYLQLPVAFRREFLFSTHLASTRQQQDHVHGRVEHRPHARLSSRRFPLEMHKSVYQWRLETSESGEVKLALNKTIKSGEGETRLEARKASPGLRATALPLLPAASAKLRTY